MRRAFVGFSGPVGYCYDTPAPETRNDQQSSPSPVLSGGLGLITLFDEVWFACESLCPPNMRRLPYVKFLDKEYPNVRLDIENFESQEKATTYGLAEDLRGTSIDADQKYQEQIQDYVNPYHQYSCDNHSHALKVFEQDFHGNPTIENLGTDLTLINRFRNLDLSIVLNGLTANQILPRFISPTRLANDEASRDLAEKVLHLNEIPGLDTPDGPYHPIIEELRGDNLIKNFRKWMDDTSNSLDNHDIKMITSDVNEKIFEFRLRADRHLVKGKPMQERCIELVKDSLLKLLPFASSAFKLAKGANEEAEAASLRWQAFASASRDRVDYLKRS